MCRTFYHECPWNMAPDCQRVRFIRHVRCDNAAGGDNGEACRTERIGMPYPCVRCRVASGRPEELTPGEKAERKAIASADGKRRKQGLGTAHPLRGPAPGEEPGPEPPILDPAVLAPAAPAQPEQRTPFETPHILEPYERAVVEHVGAFNEQHPTPAGQRGESPAEARRPHEAADPLAGAAEVGPRPPYPPPAPAQPPVARTPAGDVHPWAGHPTGPPWDGKPWAEQEDSDMKETE